MAIGSIKLIAAIVGLVGLGAAAYAATNRASVVSNGATTCVTSNSIPDHATGRFPNRGNPHRVRAQNIRFCVPSNPQKSARPNFRVGVIGVATNGVVIRPGTADWYDASSPRGHSRNRASGWNLEAVGSGKLGLDDQNAHVDKRGLYHYHAMPRALAAQGGTLIGYAADGFEIHYAGESALSGYRLRSGARATAPGGRHDGTYHQDWVYRGGGNTLDECNGGMLDGKFVYFATDTYPFFPRCLWGTQITQMR